MAILGNQKGQLIALVLMSLIGSMGAYPVDAQINTTVIALNNEGVRALETSNFKLAMEKFEAALKLDPTYGKARSNLAIAYNNYALFVNKRSPDEALKYFHKALQLDSSNPTTKANIDGIIRRMGRDPLNYQDRVDLGDQSRKQADFDGAIISYQAAVAIKDDANVREKLGDVFRVKGRLDEAINEYNNAIRIRDSANLQVKLGQALQEKGDIPNAIAALHQALKLNPTHPDVLDALMTAWDAAVRANPTAPENYIGLGQALQLRGDFDGAKAEYLLANKFSAGRKNAQAELLLAELALARQKFSSIRNNEAPPPGSSKSTTLAAAQGPSSLSSSSQTGMSPTGGLPPGQINDLVTRGKFAEASTNLDAVLKKTPLDTTAWFNYGICRQALKDYHGALAAYEMVCNLSPENQQAKDAAVKMRSFVEKQKEEMKNRAEAEKARDQRRMEIDKLIDSKRYKDAIVIIDEFVKSEPTNSSMWFKLGISKQAQADYHSALAAYEMASRLSSTDTSARTAAESMRSFLNGGGTMAPALPQTSEVDTATVPYLRARTDVDYGPYLSDMSRRIKRAWYPPKDERRPKLKLSFSVDRFGLMSNLRLTESCRLAIADRAGLKAIENAAPFRPLPDGAPENLEFAVEFYSRVDKIDVENKCIYLNDPRSTF